VTVTEKERDPQIGDGIAVGTIETTETRDGAKTLVTGHATHETVQIHGAGAMVMTLAGRP
jgi:hypothetical protein